MLWALLLHLVGFVVDLVDSTRRAGHAKDLEIALLRHQLRLLQRRAGRPPRLSRWEKRTLAVLAAKLGGPGHRLTASPVPCRAPRPTGDQAQEAPRTGKPEV